MPLVYFPPSSVEAAELVSHWSELASSFSVASFASDPVFGYIVREAVSLDIFG